MMAERKSRVWLTSLTFGCLVSTFLAVVMRKTQLGFWLPGAQPGWLFAFATRLVRPGSLANSVSDLALVSAGNAVFYSWIFSRILRAEIAARGNLSRHFLR